MPLLRFDTEGFARRVKYEMAYRDMGFTDLVIAADIPSASFARLIHEYKGCKIDVMASLAKVLELDLMDFVCHTSPRRRDYIRI